MKKIAIAAFLLALLSLPARDIYLAGDSTMARYRPKSAPMAGWGMFVKPVRGGKVYNMGIGGRSSKSYRKSGAWAKLMKRVKAGDVVLIQFGHNDANKRRAENYTRPEKEFKEFMELYIKDLKAAKVHIILASSTAPLRFNKKKQAYSYLVPYSKAAEKIAAAHKIPFIDMTAFGVSENAKAGMDKARKYYMFLEPGAHKNWPKGRRDAVHLNETGAKLYADFFIREMKTRKLPGHELF